MMAEKRNIRPFPWNPDLSCGAEILYHQ